MAGSRKDSRGYALHTGECQRKDGRYSYSYTDRNHNRHIIYSKDLMTLRKREKQIRKDIDDGINPDMAEHITINQVYDKYISQKHNLKATTKANYIYMYNQFVRDGFGKRKLASIKYSDVKEFYYSILLDKKMKANTLDNIHTQLHPTFQFAVRDGIIRTNPTDMVMREIKQSNLWVKPKRNALTIEQQKAFMNHLYDCNDYLGWRNVITVLLGTGMRIGECLGLRWEDIDMEKRVISVNHSFTYRNVEGHEGNKLIHTPKTEAGVREIPMLEDVYQAFLDEYSLQRILGFCKEEIDGFSGFIFTSSTGNVMLPSEVNRAIKNIIETCNEEEARKAEEENRTPVVVPDFSAHSLRHTFCTRFCENETNVKVIQTIMGHKDIETTLDIYADVTLEKKQDVIYNMENKILLK